MKRFFTILVLSILVVVVFSNTPLANSQPAYAQGESTTPILDRIFADEFVRCGVNRSLPGFGAENEFGVYEGFDIDICRAVAAAILGDANAVQYIPLTASERQDAIVNMTVDMLSRNTTFTLSRDITWNAIFGPTVFYDGQGVMVYKESGITSLDILAGGTICVAADTTTEQNIRRVMESYNVSSEIIALDGDQEITQFFERRCDALTADQSQLVTRRAAASDPSELQILDIPPLSKEPLAPVTPDKDVQFANIVRWVVFGLIQAEEFGVTSTNVAQRATEPGLAQFLGQGGTTSGDLLDTSTINIPNDFLYQVILQVGNYGEIYDRHLGPERANSIPRRLNELWINGGLLYSPPFR